MSLIVLIFLCARLVSLEFKEVNLTIATPIKSTFDISKNVTSVNGTTVSSKCLEAPLDDSFLIRVTDSYASTLTPIPPRPVCKRPKIGNNLEMTTSILAALAPKIDTIYNYGIIVQKEEIQTSCTSWFFGSETRDLLKHTKISLDLNDKKALDTTVFRDTWLKKGKTMSYNGVVKSEAKESLYDCYWTGKIGRAHV